MVCWCLFRLTHLIDSSFGEYYMSADMISGVWMMGGIDYILSPQKNFSGTHILYRF